VPANLSYCQHVRAICGFLSSKVSHRWPGLVADLAAGLIARPGAGLGFGLAVGLAVGLFARVSQTAWPSYILTKRGWRSTTACRGR
jgi:hypothetical protein